MCQGKDSRCEWEGGRVLESSEVGFGWTEMLEVPDEWMDINNPGA